MATTRDMLIFTVLAVQTAAIGWLVVDRLDPGDSGVLDRIDTLETGIAKAAHNSRGAELSAERQHRFVAALERRVLDVERDLPDATMAADTASTESPERATDDAERALTRAKSAKLMQRRMEADVVAQTDVVAAKLASVGIKLKTMKLRSLAEEDRWAAASEKVGLNDTQVREIQEATRNRDIEFERATSHEISTDDDGSMRKVVHVDAEIRQAADEAYTDRVSRTLNNEQRKQWRSEGFEGAFGVHRPRASVWVDRRGGKR